MHLFRYVYLDDFNKYGLGGYLFESLDQRIPIIGVAKTNKMELLRVINKNSLYIASVGIDLNFAKKSHRKNAWRIPNSQIVERIGCIYKTQQLKISKTS